MPNNSLHLARGAGAPLSGVTPSSRSPSLHNFFRSGNRALNANTNVKQYMISLALLIAALVAFPTSHANAQTQAEMNRQAAKDFHKADAELNSTYAALMAKLPDAESKRKLKELRRLLPPSPSLP